MIYNINRTDTKKWLVNNKTNFFLGPHYEAYVTVLNKTIFDREALGSMLIIGIETAEDENERIFTEEEGIN